MEFLAMPSVTMSVTSIPSYVGTQKFFFYCSNNQYMDISNTCERIKTFFTKSKCYSYIKSKPQIIACHFYRMRCVTIPKPRCIPLRSEDTCL
mmetsp:Transcript_1690/g.1845  ORF Transcript_1690/g.1845 Transcript_1690/m.1845 type:complete len:92 (+) Transcript_1690:278-553(+)